MDSGSSLEESMWQLRLESSEPPYPERPGEPDCSYYVRTGTCGYGDRCRFNHPRDSAVAGGGRSGGVVYPERVGQPACQFFLKTGTCKYGASCKYDHPRQGARSAQLVPLNYYGYPLRPGGKECSYYMRMGLCKFGSTCKFHHPEPGGAPVSSPATAFYPTVQTPVFPSPYMQLAPYGSMMISTGVVPVPGWSYPPTVSPALSPGGQHSLQTAAYPGTYTTVSSPAGPSSSSQKEQAFPERPGQPECQYYMRTGDCKFGPTCKYHHPSEWSIPRTTDCVLSPVGLPLRPGAMPCVFYAQHGVCKFGPSCKFDHSMGVLSYSPSASSLADMPVAPYPVGFSVATLAPSSSSSSSSELRPDFISNRDSYHTQVSLTESGSIGSMFSKSGYVPPQSLVPYYTPSGSGGGGSSSSSMSQGGELSSSS